LGFYQKNRRKVMTRLTKNEEDLMQRRGYWEEDIYANRSKWERELSFKKDEEVHLVIGKKQIVVPKFSVVISEYFDIATLFSSVARLSSFLDDLFMSSLDDEIKGTVPF